MRFLPALMLLAGCGASSTTPAGADLAAPPADDLAASPAADLAPRDGSAAPAGDGGACLAAPTPPTTLYLDYCMDAASSFCFRDAQPSGFF